MKTWLFNPFKFIAGNKALLLGFGAMLITAIICLLGKQHLDGVFDVHEGATTPYYFYFIEPVIDWLCLIVPLYIFGRIFSASSVRFIDVAGTSALARYPIFFVVLFGILFLPGQINNTKDPLKFINDIQIHPALLAQLTILSLFSIVFLVWTVALMYNAYSVSTNLKGQKAAWSFIASIVIAEILSKIIFSIII
jgi:hypothetical protein